MGSPPSTERGSRDDRLGPADHPDVLVHLRVAPAASRGRPRPVGCGAAATRGGTAAARPPATRRTARTPSHGTGADASPGRRRLASIRGRPARATAERTRSCLARSPPRRSPARPERPGRRPCPCPSGRSRSEEHTSELQSHHDLVCRLLLEKKKKKTIRKKNKKRDI